MRTLLCPSRLCPPQHGCLVRSRRSVCINPKSVLSAYGGHLASSGQLFCRGSSVLRHCLGKENEEALDASAAREPQQAHDSSSGSRDVGGPDLSSLPKTIAVTCNGMSGELLVDGLYVRCQCGICSKAPEGYRVWDPSTWKRHCGDTDNKRWYSRIKVQAMGVEKSVSNWLKGLGFEVLTNKKVEPGGAPPRRIVPLPKPAALGSAEGGEEELVPITDVLPPEFSVTCGPNPGTMFTIPWVVRCGCSTCANASSSSIVDVNSVPAIVASCDPVNRGMGGQFGLWSANKWEKHSGKGAQKDSYRTVHIVPGREVADGTVKQSIVKYLERKGYKPAKPPRNGGVRMLTRIKPTGAKGASPPEVSSTPTNPRSPPVVPSPAKDPSPPQNPTTPKDPSPAKEPSPAKTPSTPKKSTPWKHPSPPKRPSSPEDPSSSGDAARSSRPVGPWGCRSGGAEDISSPEDGK